MEAQEAALAQQLEEITEEHGSEEGLLAEVVNDKGKVTRGAVASRLKEIADDPEAAEEIQVLQQCRELMEQSAELKSIVKEAQQDLETKVALKYGKLSEAEIISLVVEDKWLASLAAAVQSELDRVSQTLTGRIRQLAERYEAPLPEIMDELAKLTKRVEGHLEKMGAVWK